MIIFIAIIKTDVKTYYFFILLASSISLRNYVIRVSHSYVTDERCTTLQCAANCFENSSNSYFGLMLIWSIRILCHSAWRLGWVV